MTDPIVILLVEDEAAHAEAIRRAFEAAGAEAEIQVAGSLREYRAAVAARPPDITLMDLNLPDGRALEVLTSPPVASPFPILIMTSYGNEQIAVEAMKAGALDYVVKSPEAFAGMPRTVERALREWDLLWERQRAAEALRESGHLLSEALEFNRRILDTSSIGILTYKKSGQCVSANAAAAKITGGTVAQLLAQNFHEIPSWKKCRMYQTAIRALDTGLEQLLEVQSVTTFKKDVWVSFSFSSFDSAGERHLLVFTSDITERKRAEEALQESEERFRHLFERAPFGIAMATLDGKVLALNRRMELITGFSLEEFKGINLADIYVNQNDRAELLETLKTSGSVVDYYVLLKRKDGTEYNGSLTVGIVNIGGKNVLQTLLQDITERKRMEDRVLKEALRTTALLRIAARLNAELDLNKLLMALCEETALALDVPGASVALYEPDTKVFRIAASVGLAPELHEHLTPIPHSLYDEYVQHLGSPFVVPNEQLWFNLPNVDLPRSGSPRTTVVATVGRVDQLIGTLNVHTLKVPRTFSDDDLSVLQGLADEVALAIVNARLFTEVDQQREQLRALHGQLADTHEAERRQLAQELHDQVSQNLTAIGLNLNLLRSQMLAGTDAAVLARLTDSLALVEQTTESVRSVMANLRPSVLDDYGLVAALRWYGAEVAARTGLAIDVLGEEPVPRLTVPVENTLFRIAQEALTNVTKHARASQVTLAVELECGKARLLIADNGIGFDCGLLTKPGNHRHWGLRVMSERAAAVNGLCRFESLPGKGTQVIVEVRQ